MAHALGIDIAAPGIKGGIVDTATGELVSDRYKLATPKGGEPEPMIQTTLELLELIPGAKDAIPTGIAFPTIVKNGLTLSAGNISQKWLGFEAQRRFSEAIGRDITLINDADAAGYAELHFGAAKDVPGVLILTTLGTGIGSALIYDGVMVPNTEFGFLEIDGEIAERRAAYSAKEREKPQLGAVVEAAPAVLHAPRADLPPPTCSSSAAASRRTPISSLPLLSVGTPIVTAVHRNNAGILGAAALAAR